MEHDRSTHPTVVEYAVRELFKGKSPAVAAKTTVKKLSGFENMFLGPGITTIDPAKLEDALWDRMAVMAIKPMREYGWSLDDAVNSSLFHFGQKTLSTPAKPKVFAELKKRVAQREKGEARETSARENPVAGGLICMGREVEFVLRAPPAGRSSGGKTVTAPSDAGMLYDDAGTYWPSCSLLIADFERGDEETDEGADYFGRSASVTRGEVQLPPRDIASWQRLGEIETIYYDRAGTKYPGYFKHAFNKPKGLYKLIFLIKGKAAKQPAVLYTHHQRRSGQSFYRVELPNGCIVDDRGIVLP